MAATARVTILMDQSQKLALTKQARASGVSLGEFIRNKALGTDDEGMVTLLALVKESTERANLALDQVLADIEQNRADAAKREADTRARARREFADFDFDALAALWGIGEAVPAALSKERNR